MKKELAIKVIETLPTWDAIIEKAISDDAGMAIYLQSESDDPFYKFIPVAKALNLMFKGMMQKQCWAFYSITKDGDTNLPTEKSDATMSEGHGTNEKYVDVDGFTFLAIIKIHAMSWFQIPMDKKQQELYEQAKCEEYKLLN